MKTKLILMTLLLAVSSVIYAGSCEHAKRDGPRGDGPRGEGHKSKHFRQHVLSDLNLSGSQQESFDAIMKNKRESMKAAMEVIHTDTNAELSKVLTPDQMQLLEEKKQHRGGKMEKRMKMTKRKNEDQK